MVTAPHRHSSTTPALHFRRKKNPDTFQGAAAIVFVLHGCWLDKTMVGIPHQKTFFVVLSQLEVP